MISGLWQLMRAAWRGLLAAGGAVGVLYLWPDIKGLPEEWGFRGWSQIMPDREAMAYVFLGIALMWIISIDVRPIVRRWIAARSKRALEIIVDGRRVRRFNGTRVGYLLLKCNSRVAVTDVQLRHIDDDSSRFGSLGAIRRIVHQCPRLAHTEPIEIPFFRYTSNAECTDIFRYEYERGKKYRVSLPFTRHVSLAAFANEASASATFQIDFDKDGNVSISESSMFDEHGYFVQRPDIKEEALPLAGPNETKPNA